MALYPCTANQADSIIDSSITSLVSFVTSARDYALAYRNKLLYITLPNLLIMPGSFLQGCSILEKVDCSRVTQIGSQAFANCLNLDKVIIRNSELCSLVSSGAFSGTSFRATGAGGKIYVPQSLISAYEADSIWAQVIALNPNNQILAIEGSPYEN